MNFASMKVVGRLVVAHAWTHPGRLVFTLLSTIMAATVVVWVVSGYDSLVAKFDEFGEGYLSRYSLVLVPSSTGTQFGGNGPPTSSDPDIPDSLLAQLAQDPDVLAVEPVYQTSAQIKNPKAPARPVTDSGEETASRRPGRGNQSGAEWRSANFPQGMQFRFRGSRQPALVGTDSREPLQQLVEGRWLDSGQAEQLEGVLTRSAAETLAVKVGDTVNVAKQRRAGSTSTNEELGIKVVGITEQPKTLPPPKFIIGLPPTRDPALRHGPASSALYVSRPVAEQVAGGTIRSNYAGIVLTVGTDPETLQARWRDKLAGMKPVFELQSIAEVQSELNHSTTTSAVRTQALSATGIALLAALFIIYTTLSMGVHERIRQFAVLRAVALSKAHITALIATESILLGLIGWGGGLLAGWGMLALVRLLRPEFTAEGALLGTSCIVLSGLCALGGSLAAAIMPAWQATRVRPLDAMAPRRRLHLAQLSRWTTVLGLVLICVNPLLVFYVPMPDTARYTWSAAVGCSAMALGFILLTPAAVVFCERVFGSLLARGLRIPHRLLATQLTTNLWRSVGTSITLTLGLGLFVAMQTWGYSMLGPFTPGTWVPDMLVVLPSPGLPDNEIMAVKNLPGVISDECLPLAVKQVELADDVTGFGVRASATRQDTCVMVGIDPQAGLGGKSPLFPLEFVEGDRDEAIVKLAQGRACLVPDHFARESGLSVGDRFAVSMPSQRGRGPRGQGRTAEAQTADKNRSETGTAPERIEYEIAGIVSMPGWHWMSKQGFRQGRAAGLMLADFAQVRQDFHTGQTTLFWMNLDGTVSEDQLKASLKKVADPYLLQASASAFAPREAQSVGRRRGGGRGFGEAVTLRSADSVRQQITARADGIIWALSQLPLVTLAVTSLGLINTVLASIRARRWDLGVLRALGVTRFTVFRLIIAEALLIGLVACLLGLGFGVMAGYCGTGVTRYINIRGGMITPLIIPWTKLAIGFAATLSLCLLAALWPAASTGRTEPLRLLQAGRAFM